MLENLNAIPVDPLLKIIGEYAADERSDKIDLGVGVYKNADGQTTVMKAVKRAEQNLVDEQFSKSYIGLAGDMGFVEEIRKLTFGDIARGQNRLMGLQTPGGSGALRLAGDLIKKSNPAAKIWIGLPCWSNHIHIFKMAGLKIETYNRYDSETSSIAFDTIVSSLSAANHGDIILLQGCCDNPTGADFSLNQWKTLASLCNQFGLIPLVDLAYQGLGQGLTQDVAGLSTILDQIPEALITVSCSKNFGLYRERTGALFVLASDNAQSKIVRSNLFSLARAGYSMPPDHGAVVVRLILRNPETKEIWVSELDDMRERIITMRHSLAAHLEKLDGSYKFIRCQKGMFSLLPLRSDQIEHLRVKYGIYMAGNGRINIAGLNVAQIERFSTALNTFI